MNNDLISRSALKKSIKSYADDQYAENEYLGECAIMTIIDNVPATPNEYMRGYEAAEREYKRPQGEWTNTSPYDDKGECSLCCYLSKKYYKFCPYCGSAMQNGGADMRGEEK